MSESKPWHRSYAPGVPHYLKIEEITLSRALTHFLIRYAAERAYGPAPLQA